MYLRGLILLNLEIRGFYYFFSASLLLIDYPNIFDTSINIPSIEYHPR
jgi:hypothetical protein